MNASFFRVGPSLHVFKGFVYEDQKDIENAHVAFGPRLRSRWCNADAHKIYRFTRTASLDLWLCEEQWASNYTVVQEIQVSVVAHQSQPEAVLEHIVVLLDTVVTDHALAIQVPERGFTDVAAHVEAVIDALSMSMPRNEK